MPRQGGADYNAVKRVLRQAGLNTVCEEANCPNRGECFSAATATFLLMGPSCTRRCTFCNIRRDAATPLQDDEPRRVAEAVRRLGLQFAVVTSVTRDDLPDGGAAHFAATIRHLRLLNPGVGVEVLIPDFAGRQCALETVLAAEPDVLNHNLETVPRLYPQLRPEADYERSLELLARARRWADTHEQAMRVKTGIMVGVGETYDEIAALMRAAAASGVSVLTVGQYLQPSRDHHPVTRYYEPHEFDELAALGRRIGLDWIEAGPLVRSSYHARQQVDILARDQRQQAGRVDPRSDAAESA